MLRPQTVRPEQSGKLSGFLSGQRPFTWRGPTFLRSWCWPWARPVQGPPGLDLSVVAVGDELHHPGPFALEQLSPGEKATIAGSWHRKPGPASVRPAARGLLCGPSSWERSSLLLP